MTEEELEGWGATDAPPDGYTSEAELDTRKLIVERRKKKAKSGGFQSMGLSNSVMKGIYKKGYNIPTPIQRKTISVIMEGKDVVAMARTGSGKTAAFLIPMFEKLQSHVSKTGTRALIISPTRELAQQTLKFTKELGKFTGLRAAVVLGGDSMNSQFAAMHDNPDIIIATPGRLVHVCVEMNIKFQSVQFVVLDEADQLFELGFTEQLNDILGRLPEVRQMVLFSATLPKMLVEFARAGLHEPVLIRLDAEHILSENLQLAFFKCNSEDKLGLLFHTLKHIIDSKQQTVVFAATKQYVEYLHMALDMANIPNTYCYSSLDPTLRKTNVAKFRQRQVQCLLVTDVAARGIDIPLLDNVINYNFPGKPKLFVHRVGRVARAGRSGVAYSFVAPDEAPYLIDLHLFLSKELRIAPHPPDESKKDDWNYMYGSVPQTIVDNESEAIAGMHFISSDLEKLKISCTNAYKQYTKARPLASAQSVKRMKENEWVALVGYHPLLVDFSSSLEHERLEMLKSLRNLQPKGTVFEMIKGKKGDQSQSFGAMKAKREIDDHRIEKFHKSLKARQKARKVKEAKAKQAAEKVGKMEMSSDSDVRGAFSAVVSSTQEEEPDENAASTSNKISKGKGSDEKINRKRKQDKENQNFKDMEYYIPYTRNSDFADKGYSVGSSFFQSSEANTLDLVVDDDETKSKRPPLHKWDRLKKKFVGTQSQEKKIKTESGVWISASYKTNAYQKWLKQGMQKDLNESSDEDDGSQRVPGKRLAIKKGPAKVHPLLKNRKKSDKKPVKRELLTEGEVRKEQKRRSQVRLNRAIGKARKILKIKTRNYSGRRLNRIRR